MGLLTLVFLCLSCESGSSTREHSKKNKNTSGSDIEKASGQSQTSQEDSSNPPLSGSEVTTEQDDDYKPGVKPEQFLVRLGSKSRDKIEELTLELDKLALKIQIKLSQLMESGKDQFNLVQINELEELKDAIDEVKEDNDLSSLQDEAQEVLKNVSDADIFFEEPEYLFGKDDKGKIGTDGLFSDFLVLKVPYIRRLPKEYKKDIHQFVIDQLVGLNTGEDKWFASVSPVNNLDAFKNETKVISDNPMAAGLHLKTNDFFLFSDNDIKKQYYLESIYWHQLSGDQDFLSLVSKAKPVTVAVIDSGVDFSHKELKAAAWDNGEGIVGYDVTLNTSIEKSKANDATGHGTHVAGIIAAAGDNDLGIHGLAFGDSKSLSRIMSIKVVNNQGKGNSLALKKGIRWAHNNHKRDVEKNGSNDKLIYSISLSGPFDRSQQPTNETKDSEQPKFIDEIIEFVTKDKKSLFIVSAGNDSCSLGEACSINGIDYKETFMYPCSFENVICVAASTHEDKLTGFSNRKATIDLVAPGWAIYSTVPEGKYNYLSGTSQSAPIVSAIAASLWAVFPDFDADTIKSILGKSSSRIAAIMGEVDSSEGGRVDAMAAFKYALDLYQNDTNPDELDINPDYLNNEPAKFQFTYQPRTDSDPYAKSNTAFGGKPFSSDAKTRTSGQNNKETTMKSSSGGCGTIGSAMAKDDLTSRLAMLLMLLFPIALLRVTMD